MKDIDDSKDLLMDISDNTLELLKTGVVSPELFNVRDEINALDVSALDEYSDNLLYQAYFAAKTKKTSSPSVIAKELKISKQLYLYYLKKYPKLAVVVNMGVIDAKESMKQSIVDALFEAAKGQKVSETSVAVEEVFDTEGALLGTKQKTTTVNKVIPPNIQAALELMRKLDPSWTPNVKIDVNHTENKTLHVIEDLNVSVDYRKLSPDALRELIQSSKSEKNQELQRLESGEPIRQFTQEVVPKINETTGEVTGVRKQSKRKMPKIEGGYKTRAKKTKLILQNHENLVEKMKEKAKQEADNIIKGD